MAAAEPMALPRKPMNAASVLKSAKTDPLPIPMAFMSPISRVRSCTDINRVFTIPNPAAIRAMTANASRTPMMPLMTVLTVPIRSSRLWAV